MKLKTLFLALALLLLAGALFRIGGELLPGRPEQSVFFSEESVDWVRATEAGTLAVDTYLATRGESRIEPGKQDLLDGERLLSFFISGSYQGEPFSTYALPEGFFNETRGLSTSEKRERAEALSPMRISPEMRPGDGVIEGYILARRDRETGKIIFHLFLDADFRQLAAPVNIVWGEDLSNPSTLQTRPFSFAEGKEGIYADRIEDTGWAEQSPSLGGILVGQVSTDSQDTLQRQGATYLIMR